MSGADDGAADPGPRILAGEYVLGVLDAEEMRVVRQRARGEPDLAAEIATWEALLLPMAGAVAPKAPPAALWLRIEQRIAALPEQPANDAGPIVAPVAQVAVVARRPRGAQRGWVASTAVSLALAAGFAVLAFLPRPLPPPQRLAAIAPMGAPSPAFIVAAQADGTVTLAAVTPVAVPADRDMELWILRPGAAKVASLGLLPAGGKTVRLDAVPATGTQLLISQEPTGGSPTGQPTGPVLYSGTLVSL